MGGRRYYLSAVKTVLLLLIPCIACAAEPWRRHVIDNSSRGADGVRLHGRDIVTGWEEGGVVNVYRYPGKERVREPWPTETAGRIGSPEDAVFADLDGDGTQDVLSASEGTTRSLQVHWAPKWRTEVIPQSVGMMQWMFSAVLDAGRIVSAGKGPGAALGIWELPSDPHDVPQWKWTPLRPVGWIMSIIPRDMDGDGDTDILFSDRRGPRSGVYWLEAPLWKEHSVGALGREVMFIAAEGKEILAAVKEREIHWFHAGGSAEVIPMPTATGTAKAVRLADLDRDGQSEIVFSCEQTPDGASGVMGMKRKAGKWEAFPISGAPGRKYDLLEVMDVDGDGDLDLITCEETTNLGVIWFENPLR